MKLNIIWEQNLFVSGSVDLILFLVARCLQHIIYTTLHTVSTQYLASVCTVASVKVTVVVGWAGVGTSALHRGSHFRPNIFSTDQPSPAVGSRAKLGTRVKLGWGHV